MSNPFSVMRYLSAPAGNAKRSTIDSPRLTLNASRKTAVSPHGNNFLTESVLTRKYNLVHLELLNTKALTHTPTMS